MTGVEEEAAAVVTRWTPRQGPPRTATERLSHHVWRHKLLWYIAAVVSTSLAFQITGLGR